MRPLILITALAFAIPANAAPAKRAPASDWPLVCHMLRGTTGGLVDPNQPIAVTLRRNAGAEYFRCNPVKIDVGMKPAEIEVSVVSVQ